MRNLMELLRKMPKPNRSEHGGKGLFWFCQEDQCCLEDRRGILSAIWNAPTARSRPASLVDFGSTEPRSDRRAAD
jgi:hypothetical protein